MGSFANRVVDSYTKNLKSVISRLGKPNGRKEEYSASLDKFTTLF